MPFAGAERLSFDLSTFGSRVTRELLQIRMRKQAQAFGVGEYLVPATVVKGGAELQVDTEKLLAVNAEVRGRLEQGVDGPIRYLQALGESRRTLTATARQFRQALEDGAASDRTFYAYIDASTDDQELGALKFCLPPDLPGRLRAFLSHDPGLAEALTQSETPSLWSGLRMRELALARLRLRGATVRYRKLLAQHRQFHGYLSAEDVDFQASEHLQAIDQRIADLAAQGLRPLEAQFRALVHARAAERSRRAAAAQAFARALSADGQPTPLIALVLLARRLNAHEDQNRRGKMRLLRDLRDLAQTNGLDIALVGLRDLAATCGR